MAKLIQFYIPSRHHSKVRWMPKQNWGKLIMFPAMKTVKIAAPKKVTLKMNWEFLHPPSRSAK
jgi:hypothetical protein